MTRRNAATDGGGKGRRNGRDSENGAGKTHDKAAGAEGAEGAGEAGGGTATLAPPEPHEATADESHGPQAEKPRRGRPPGSKDRQKRKVSVRKPPEVKEKVKATPKLKAKVKATPKLKAKVKAKAGKPGPAAAVERKTPNDRMRELLDDAPNMPAVDVMTILLGEHLIRAKDRPNAERAFYKIRRKTWRDKNMTPTETGRGQRKTASILPPGATPPAPLPAAEPKGLPPTGVAAKPDRVPVAAPAAPPAGPSALDRAVGVALDEAHRSADPDRPRSQFQNLILTKQALTAAVGLAPLDFARRLVDLTDQVGKETRQCLECLGELDAIKPAAAKEPATA